MSPPVQPFIKLKQKRCSFETNHDMNNAPSGIMTPGGGGYSHT